MMIVDAQIHLWAKGKPSAHHRQTPFLKDEALAACRIEVPASPLADLLRSSNGP
jgi:hypothetical protein